MNHYHIRWANSKIDWQAFQTKDEAVAEAEGLKRRDENYNIEERDGNCERCLSLNQNTRVVECSGHQYKLLNYTGIRRPKRSSADERLP